jgi:hypothetical protein
MKGPQTNSLFNSILASYTAIVSILDFRYFKSTGVPRGTEVTSKSERIEEGERENLEK